MSEQHPPEKSRVTLQLQSLGPVVKMAAIYCPNNHGIHEKIYIRYLILINAQNHAVFIDDPTDGDMTRLWRRSHSNVEGVAASSECPWCQSLTAKDEEKSS